MKREKLERKKSKGQSSNINNSFHFLITMTVLGMKQVVGKTHNITESNWFQFIDLLDHKEDHGTLTYEVVPVYYDYTRGTPVSSNKVVI